MNLTKEQRLDIVRADTKKQIIADLGMKHGGETIVKIDKGEKYHFVEPNSVSSRGELLQHVYMVAVDKFEEEMGRLKRNHQKNGIFFIEVPYRELSQNIIIDAVIDAGKKIAEGN